MEIYELYVDKMIDTYVQLYGEKPRKALFPLEQNDHPEMDNSPFLRQDETQQFQSLIGAMQWAVSIGRLDITTAVMSLSSFRAMPRRGHLERAKKIYGYLRKMKEARIQVLGEVTQTKDGCSKNLTRTRNVPPKCNKQVTSKQQTRSFLTSIN
jgi:hypothetical protein